MANINKTHLMHVIVNIFQTILLIISCILIFSQTIINIRYNYSKNKNILAEKLVYEQFSYDVYSNINNKILYDFEVINFSKDCPEDKEPIIFQIKLDSYYDCDGDYIKTIGKNENSNDTSKDNCDYYNKYNGRFSQFINGYKICAKKTNYGYEYLFYLNKDKNIKGDNCLYLDSYKHCIDKQDINGKLKFEIENTTFTLDNSNVIVKNIISEIIPNYFEYEILLKESIFNNKIKQSKKEKEEVDNYKEINNNNIYDVFLKKIDNSFKGGNVYFNNQKNISLGKILKGNNEPVFSGYQNNSYMKLNTSWYTRNYIGFKNFEELIKFKENFDENDAMNNPLYQISNDILYPNIESIFVILIFLAEFIISFIVQIKSFYSKKTVKIKNYLISDSITQMFSPVLLIIYFFIYLFKYVYKYKKISIDMEIYYKLVLDQYNKRRRQDCLLGAIILLFISLVLILINYMIMSYIYDLNGINSPSGHSIICTLRNSQNNEEYQFKFYLNRKFSNEMERFKEKYFKKYDIEICKFIKNENDEDENELIIDENLKVGEIGLQNKSIINVICELK